MDLLLELESDDSEVWNDRVRLWKLPIDPRLIVDATRMLDDGVLQCVEKKPQFLEGYLSFKARWGKLMERLCLYSEAQADWFSDPKFPSLILLLAALSEYEDSQEPAPRWLHELASEYSQGEGAVILQAYSNWSLSLPRPPEVQEKADEVGLDVEKLHAIYHWRKIAGQSEPWPKAIRRLSQPPAKWSEKSRLKVQLKVEQGLKQTYQDCSKEAWQRLLCPVICQLAAEVLEMPTWWASLRPELLPALWTLNDRFTRPEIVRTLFDPAPRDLSPPNRQWLDEMSPKIVVDQWLGKVQETWFEGEWQYQWSTASCSEILKMGNEFGTCLALKTGAFSFMAVTHALDINKKVLWLRNFKGQAVARQLIGMTHSGKLTPYPIYYKDPTLPQRFPELEQQWRKRLEAFAQRCGATLGEDSEELPSLHSHQNSYLDSPDLGAQDAPGPLSADIFDKLLEGEDGSSGWRHQAWAMELGRLNWLDSQGSRPRPRRSLRQQNWSRLHYRTPWQSHWIGYMDYLRPENLPAAMVDCPLRDLLAVSAKLFRKKVTIMGWESQRFVTLVLVRCLPEPAPQLWPYLGHKKTLRPLAWLIADLLPQGARQYQKHLRRSSHRSRPYEQMRMACRLGCSGFESDFWYGQYPWEETYADLHQIGLESTVADVSRRERPNPKASKSIQSKTLRRSPHLDAQTSETPTDKQQSSHPMIRSNKQQLPSAWSFPGSRVYGTKTSAYLASLIVDAERDHSSVAADDHWSLSKRSWRSLVQGLLGDKERLWTWMFRVNPDEWDWRCQLVARLWFDGRLPHLDGEELRGWSELAAPDSWPCLELRAMTGWPAHPRTSVRRLLLALYFPHLRRSALDAIVVMEPKERDQLILEASDSSPTTHWQRLVGHRPRPDLWDTKLKNVVDQVLRAQGLRADRLQDWLRGEQIQLENKKRNPTAQSQSGLLTVSGHHLGD